MHTIRMPCGQPPFAPVGLVPGGRQIMPVGLKKPLDAGRSFPLSPAFTKAAARTIDLSAEKVRAGGPATMPAMQR